MLTEDTFNLIDSHLQLLFK